MPPLITSTFVARKSPPPSNNPNAIPHAWAFNARIPSWIERSRFAVIFLPCAEDESSVISDMIEEIACGLQFGPRSNRERGDGEGKVAAERDEPSGDERDEESIRHSHEYALPRPGIAGEVLTNQIERESLRARHEQ